LDYEPYSAVVLYYRRGPEIRRTLNRLLMQKLLPAEIVVVDNASGDGVIDTIRDEYPLVTFVTLPHNVGYAGGMNAGLERVTDSAFTLFLSHDVILQSACVLELVSAMSDGTVAVAGPALKLADTGEARSYGGVLTGSGGLRHLKSAPEASRVDVEWLDGSVLLTRTSDARAVGGFDERYFLYWEDVDFCSRMSSRGRVVNVPTAVASQASGTTPVYYSARNRLIYWRSRSRGRYAASVLAVGAKLVLRDLATGDGVGRERGRARVRGLVDGLTGRLDTSLFDRKDR
jgi:N-acetylglucosaminyl-diphospho-decaprenol L-rhamnosyltransferase